MCHFGTNRLSPSLPSRRALTNSWMAHLAPLIVLIPITTGGINAALVDTKSLVKRALSPLLFHKVMVAE